MLARESEHWHGKAVQTGCMFMPECPLVQHVIKSYIKHYTGEHSLIKDLSPRSLKVSMKSAPRQALKRTVTPSITPNDST